MSKITLDDVRNVAQLARLDLGEDELLRMRNDLDEMLVYVETLEQLDTTAIAPMTHAATIETPYREDQIRPGLSLDSALSNAPQQHDGAFVVPRVL